MSSVQQQQQEVHISNREMMDIQRKHRLLLAEVKDNCRNKQTAKADRRKRRKKHVHEVVNGTTLDETLDAPEELRLLEGGIDDELVVLKSEERLDAVALELSCALRLNGTGDSVHVSAEADLYKLMCMVVEASVAHRATLAKENELWCIWMKSKNASDKAKFEQATDEIRDMTMWGLEPKDVLTGGKFVLLGIPVGRVRRGASVYLCCLAKRDVTAQHMSLFKRMTPVVEEIHVGDNVLVLTTECVCDLTNVKVLLALWACKLLPARDKTVLQHVAEGESLEEVRGGTQEEIASIWCTHMRGRQICKQASEECSAMSNENKAKTEALLLLRRLGQCL